MTGCSRRVTPQLNQASVLPVWRGGGSVYLPPDCQHKPLFFLPLFCTIRQYKSSCSRVCLTFLLSFFFCLLQILLLCLHITGSLVFRSPSSLWQWNTVTPISGGPSTPKHSCVAVPLSCHRTSRLPTLLPLSSTNSAAFPFHSALFPFTPALPLFSSLPSLALPEDGSVKDKGQTKSQHSLQTSALYRRSLAPVLHFTFDFSVSVRGTPLRAASVWHATRLPNRPCWIKNTAYAADSTLLCYKEETYPLFRKWSTHLTWTARCLLI